MPEVLTVNSPGDTLIGIVLTNSAIVGFVISLFWVGVIAFRLFGKKMSFSLAPLGFARPRSGLLRGVITGFVVGIGALLISIVITPINVLVLEKIGYPAKSSIQEPFMRSLAKWVADTPGIAILAILLVVVIFSPVVEELVFRGALFNGLHRLGSLLMSLLFSRPSPHASKRIEAKDEYPEGGELEGKEETHSEQRKPLRKGSKVSFVFSAILSSGFFALIHLEPIILPAIFVLAVGLCVLFQRSGSLLPPIVAHATFNSFATVMIVLQGLGMFTLPT